MVLNTYYKRAGQGGRWEGQTGPLAAKAAKHQSAGQYFTPLSMVFSDERHKTEADVEV